MKILLGRNNCWQNSLFTGGEWNLAIGAKDAPSFAPGTRTNCSASAPLPHRFRPDHVRPHHAHTTTSAPLRRRLRTASAPRPRRRRTASAPLPHRFPAASAPRPHRLRTASTPLPHRTALAPLLHRFRIASSRQGGALYNNQGNVAIMGSTTFVNNTAGQVGGYPTFRSARADSYVCRLGCFHLPHRAKTSTTTAALSHLMPVECRRP
jgi:hypothetical protein